MVAFGGKVGSNLPYGIVDLNRGQSSFEPQAESGKSLKIKDNRGASFIADHSLSTVCY
jgi:hypothetical protein